MNNAENKKLEVGLEIKGHTYYKFKSMDMIPDLRLEAYLARNHEFEDLRVRHTDLLAFCQTVVDLGNEARHMEVQQLNGYLMSLVQKEVTLHPTCYLASPLVILDDEDPEEIDADIDKQKITMGVEMQKVESFFLRTILNLSPGLEDSLPPGQTSVYSNPQEKMIEMLFHQGITGRKTLT